MEKNLYLFEYNNQKRRSKYLVRLFNRLIRKYMSINLDSFYVRWGIADMNYLPPIKINYLIFNQGKDLFVTSMYHSAVIFKWPLKK